MEKYGWTKWNTADARNTHKPIPMLSVSVGGNHLRSPAGAEMELLGCWVHTVELCTERGSSLYVRGSIRHLQQEFFIWSPWIQSSPAMAQEGL